MKNTLLLFLAMGAVALGGDFYLKHGDRVVFYGDSITDQRLYTTIAETYVVTRYPGSTSLSCTPAGAATG